MNNDRKSLKQDYAARLEREITKVSQQIAQMRTAVDNQCLAGGTDPGLSNYHEQAIAIAERDLAALHRTVDGLLAEFGKPQLERGI